MSPALRGPAIILGGIAAFIGFVWLSFWMDTTAVMPWFGEDELARESGIQHDGWVLVHEGGFQDYRGMFHFSGDASLAAAVAAGVGATEHQRARWSDCMLGGSGPWWWRQAQDAIGDCYGDSGDTDGMGIVRVHRDDASDVITILISRN
jgi:hypothetical protein